MDLAAQYARAIYAAKNPDMSRTLAALKKRGHLKLSPRIYAELKKLQTRDARAAMYREVTPEMQRAAMLLELYRKLTAN